MLYPSIAQHFSQYFQLVVANTPELKQEVYRIRYQVYCQELKYEPCENFPDGLEKDIYDRRSIHYLLKHLPSGIYAGCARVVLPNAYNPKLIFPAEKVFPEHFATVNRPRTEFCEFSRLAVLSQFRKRKGESQTPEGLLFHSQGRSTSQAERRVFPLIALSLYWASIGTGPAFNLDVLVLIEPRLARHFRRYGIIAHQISDLVEYRGKRGLFLIQPTEFRNNLRADIREFFDFIDAERTRQFELINANRERQLQSISA